MSKKKILKVPLEKQSDDKFLETFCIKRIVNIIVDLKNLQKSANNVESSFNKDTANKAITKLLGANATISRVTGLKVNYFEKQPLAQQSEYLEDKRQRATCTGLSIDSGLMHTLIPAVILQAIEEKYKIETHKLFDCIGGTGFGSLIAFGLTAIGKTYRR